MKIKKYEGSTEKEAMLKVKEELGREALIVSVKNIRPRGIFRLFKKPYVEVTAALDETGILKRNKETNIVSEEAPQETVNKDQNNIPFENSNFVELLRTLADTKHTEKANDIVDDKIDEKPMDYGIKTGGESKELPFLKVVYELLLSNDVDEAYINILMQGLGDFHNKDENNINDAVSIIYKRIVKLLSDFEPIKLVEGQRKIAVFIGPTGVGKTTTIAKIASYFTLNLRKKVALITSDTYRIAAVEQLRTYANILNIPVKVVYKPEEMMPAIDSFKDADLILIDTAGRSHKNQENQDELIQLLNCIDEKEIYLVLSLTTKYKDLIKITNAHHDIRPYKLIFTKLDETSSYGNILNIKLNTNAKLSYIAFGQNVPDDISEVNVHEIAKKILGGSE